MTSVILALVIPPTADAWQCGIAIPDVSVEGLLGLLDPITAGFHCEASDFELVFLFAFYFFSSSFCGLYGLLVRFLP